jgi:hypothetical protein
MIELTNTEMFKGLTEVQIENSFFDLHNDFICSVISFDASKREINMAFVSEKKGINFSYLLTGASIEKMYSNRKSGDCNIMNNFYRGRFELDNVLSEFFEDGSSYFYLEFENGDLFEIKAKKLFADL